MNNEARILGTKARFFRDGSAFTLPDPGGTAGRTARPDDDDPAWIDFGVILDAGVELEREEKEVWGPDIGAIKLHDIVPTKRGMIRSFTVQELSPLAIEVLYGTTALDALSDDYLALAGKTKKGWVIIDRYDQRDTLIVRERAYVYLQVVGEVKLEADLATIPFEARQLIPRTAGIVATSSQITTEDGFLLTDELGSILTTG